MRRDDTGFDHEWAAWWRTRGHTPADDNQIAADTIEVETDDE